MREKASATIFSVPCTYMSNVRVDELGKENIGQIEYVEQYVEVLYITYMQYATVSKARNTCCHEWLA